MKIKQITKITALLAVGGLMVAPAARADLIFDLGIGNSAISGYTGPYATVDVSLTDSTHAKITYSSLTANGNIYLMGDGGTVGVNVNATSWTVGSLATANSGSGFSPSQLASGGSGNEDGFGSFNQTFNSFDGYTHSSDSVSFILIDTSGTWSSASDVLTANGSGYEAAAHIFVTSSPADASGSALTTGYAANGVVTVPEATTVIAGLLLVLPLGASTIRILRRNRTA
jgi:hypothetical protein